MAKPERVYWDSCAWLGLANGEQERVKDLDAVYDMARSGRVEIWTSTISLVEVNRLDPEKNSPKPIPPDSLKPLDDLFFQSFVKLIPVDTPIARQARRLIRETPGLGKKPDAIHLASALFWSLPEMHTYDRDDLLHLDGKMRGRDETLLKICEPGQSDLGDLFGKSKITG